MKKLFTILFVLSAYVSFGQAYIGQDGAIHPTGKFPVIFSNEAKGTIKRVKSLTDRDAIAQNLRDTGMLCWVTDSSRFYVLSGGTSNTRWINFSSATGGGTGIGNEFDPLFTQSPSFTITNEKKAYWDLVGLMMRIDSARKEMHDTAVAHDVIFDPNTFFYRNDTLSIIFPQDQTGGSNVTQEQIDLWNTILDTSLHPTADTIRAWIAKIKLNDTIYLDKNGFSGFGETSNDPVKNKAFTSFQKINDSTIRFWTGDSLFQDLAIKDIVGGNSSDTAIQSIAMLSDSTGFRVFKKTGFYDVFLKGTRSGSGGSGTVTNVSVVNTFGVSGTVTNPTTTPALTLAIDTTKFVTTHQLNLVVNNFADSLSTIRNYIDTNISNIQNQVTNITNGSAGTVKSVSVVNTFGLTGTVTNPTTTPAITLTIDSTKYSTVSNVNTSIKNVVNNFGDSIANVKNIITSSVSKVLPYNADSSFYLGGDTTLHRLPVAPATSDSIDYAFTAMTTVYNEAGPGEYVSSAHGLTANKDNFNFPFRQLKSFDIGTWTDGDYISFNNATIASSTNFTFLRAFIRLKSVVPVSGTISFAFYYNGTQVSKTISCVNYGIDKSKVGVYQNVSIPFSAFGFTANNFDELRLKFGGTQSDGIYMDLVQFQNASVFENTFITDLFKKPLTDSVFKVVGGINVYAFRDSGGGSTIDTASMLSPYLKSSVAASSYFPLQGGAITGTGGNGYVGLIPQSSTPSTPTSGFKLFATNPGAFAWITSQGYARELRVRAQTQNNIYYLQDKSYTLADSADVAGKLNITDTANIRLRAIAGANMTITGTYPNLTFNSAGGGTDNTAYHTVTKLSDSTGFTLNRPNGTKDTIQIAIPAGGVTNIFKVTGKDSIFFTIAGVTYAIKDSTGGGGGGVAGSSTQIQYNNAGALGASSTFTYSPTPTISTSKVISGLIVSPTVNATQNGDTTVGAYFTPVLNAGIWSGVQKYAFKTQGDVFVNGQSIGSGAANDLTSFRAGNLAYTATTVANNANQVNVGYQAGQLLNASSFLNTFVGAASGRTVTGGQYNTGIGAGALGLMTGSNNTGIGNDALTNSTGSNNVGIGKKAGRQSASNGVYIGSNAGEAETGSNKLYINNVSNGGLIVGDFSTGQIRVNSEANVPNASAFINPAATFEVNNYPIGTNRGSIPAPVMLQVQRDAIATQTGKVTRIVYSTPGTGYTSAPTVSITGSGTGATATATLSAGSYYFTVTNGGSGYTPGSTTVTISGGGGTGMTAYAIVGNAGLSVYCADCTATDSSIGVLQYWNGSAWKNAW